MSSRSLRGAFAHSLMQALQDAGYEVVRRARNSHLVMETHDGRPQIVMPAKIDDLALAKKIAKIARVSVAFH